MPRSSTSERAAATPVARWTGTDLEGLTPRAGGALRSLAEPIDYPAGAVILREGAPTPFLGLVETGRVALRLPVPGRGPQIVVTLEPGDLIGWSAVVAPYRASAEAVAMTPTRLETFPADRIRELLAADCEIASEVLPVVLAAVSGRLTTSWHQLLDLFGMRGVGPW